MLKHKDNTLRKKIWENLCKIKRSIYLCDINLISFYKQTEYGKRKQHHLKGTRVQRRLP